MMPSNNNYAAWVYGSLKHDRSNPMYQRHAGRNSNRSLAIDRKPPRELTFAMEALGLSRVIESTRRCPVSRELGARAGRVSLRVLYAVALLRCGGRRTFE